MRSLRPFRSLRFIRSDGIAHAYLRLIANRGLVRALRTDASLLPGINTYQGKLTIGPVGEALGLTSTDIRTLLPA